MWLWKSSQGPEADRSGKMSVSVMSVAPLLSRTLLGFSLPVPGTGQAWVTVGGTEALLHSSAVWLDGLTFLRGQADITFYKRESDIDYDYKFALYVPGPRCK